MWQYVTTYSGDPGVIASDLEPWIQRSSLASTALKIRHVLPLTPGGRGGFRSRRSGSFTSVDFGDAAVELYARVLTAAAREQIAG
jgi:hypothetical protein